MKTIVSLLIAVTVIIATTFSAAAQSKSLPVDSVASATSHNLLLLKYVYGSLDSPSLLNTNGSKTFWLQNYNANNVPKVADLVAMVATNSFAFLLARPSNDMVNVFISYNAGDGVQLFYANANFQLVMSNGAWQVPASMTNLQTCLAYYEPIYEKNAVGAHFNLRDGNETILQTTYLDVYQVGTSSAHVGRIMNPTVTTLGQHGEIVVTYGQFDQWGNQTNSFDVAFATDEGKGGAAIVPANVKGVFGSSWDGLVKVLTPPNISLTNVLSVNHVGTSQLVEFTLTNTMTVYFHAETTEGEWANGFTVKLLQPGADLPAVPYGIPSGYYSGGVSLPAGTYHADFTWPLLAPQQQYPWWYYYTGGGTVTTPVVGKGG
ncbi:MAG: hypothetical protein WCQ60_01705 [bacterium]